MMYLTLLVVARTVIWNGSQLMVLHGYMLSHHDRIVFFKYELRVKIRCEKQRLTKEDFCDRWIKEISLIRVKGAKQNWLFLAFV